MQKFAITVVLLRSRTNHLVVVCDEIVFSQILRGKEQCKWSASQAGVYYANFSRLNELFAWRKAWGGDRAGGCIGRGYHDYGDRKMWSLSLEFSAKSTRRNELTQIEQKMKLTDFPSLLVVNKRVQFGFGRMWILSHKSFEHFTKQFLLMRTFSEFMTHGTICGWFLSRKKCEMKSKSWLRNFRNFCDDSEIVNFSVTMWRRKRFDCKSNFRSNESMNT